MGLACSTQAHVPETYNLSSLKFNSLNNFSERLGIRHSVISRLRGSFRRLDHDKSGSISMAEFLVMLHIDTTRFTKRAFALIDEDGDGQVDFFEFVVAIWNYCTLDWESLVRFSFNLFDIDRSGSLEIEEIEKLVCYVAGSKKVDRRMKKVLGIMDNNKDGKVSFDEFVKYNRKFPSILFPAFSMQMKLRTKVLGVPFWEARTVDMVELRSRKGITVQSVVDDIQSRGVEERRAAQRAIKATTRLTKVAKKKRVKKEKEKEEEGGENSKNAANRTRKNKEEELPSNHQYVQPKKIKVGSKKSKKSSGARSELVEEGKDGDNYTLSNIGRMLSPFSAKRKRREKNKTQKRRTSYGDTDNDTHSDSVPSFTSFATVKTEITNFNVVNGSFVHKGSNAEPGASKKKGGGERGVQRPTSDDIRGIQKTMAKAELDRKFKRNSVTTIGQHYAKTNANKRRKSKFEDKENGHPLPQIFAVSVPSPPPPPSHDSVENTWGKLRKPLEPRRPRPLDTPPNKKKSKKSAAMFSPFSPAAKKFAAAVMSPFSGKKRGKKGKHPKKERTVKFKEDIATSIHLPETPTKLSIIEFR